MEMPGGRIYEDKFLTSGFAPGYRHVTLHLELNKGPGTPAQEVRVELSPEDSERILLAIYEAHGLAWRARDGRNKPLDLREGEPRPLWIDQVPR